MRNGVSRSVAVILFLILIITGFFLNTYDLTTNAFAQDDHDLFSGDPESCSMCHVNIEIKILKAKTKHMEAGVDCITCHGISLGHIVNEINEVKPNRVIPRSKMNSFFIYCHECSTAEEKRLPPTLCTDCHDAHATLIPGG